MSQEMTLSWYSCPLLKVIIKIIPRLTITIQNFVILACLQILLLYVILKFM